MHAEDLAIVVSFEQGDPFSCNMPATCDTSAPPSVVNEREKEKRTKGKGVGGG